MVRSTMPSVPSTSISTLTLLLMWSNFWGFAFGQVTVRPASTTTPVPVATTPTVSMEFQAIPTLTTCQNYRVTWTDIGELAGYNVTLYALGTEGSVTTSPSTSSSAIVATTSRALAASNVSRSRKRAPGDKVDQLLGTVSADDSRYDFLVNIPSGRYYLHGRLDTPQGTAVNSQLFWVVEGRNTSCIDRQVATSSAVSASVSTSASSSTSTSGVVASSAASSAVAAGAESGSGSQGVGTGAIAGIVVGVVGGLGAFAALWYFCFRRKRNNDVEISGPTMVSRGPGFGSGATLATMGGGGRRSSRHSGYGGGHIALTSIGGSAEGQDKNDTSPGSNGSDNALTPSSPGGDPFATGPNTPMYAENNGFAFNDVAISDDHPPVSAIAGPTASDPRRRSQPLPRSPSTSERTRSSSQPSLGPSGKVGLKRNVSARRKPVPSLGADLRKQTQREQAGDGQDGERQGGPGQKKEVFRQTFQIMPDPPKAPQ